MRRRRCWQAQHLVALDPLQPAACDDGTFQSDSILPRRVILRELRCQHTGGWVENGTFPRPVILNPGSGRELSGWLTADFEQWRASRPRRARVAFANASTR